MKLVIHAIALATRVSNLQSTRSHLTHLHTFIHQLCTTKMEDQLQLRPQPHQHQQYLPSSPSNDRDHEFPHQLQTHKNGSSFIFSFSAFKKMLFIACMLPLSFAYLTLASLSLTAAVAGLAITTPLLLLFSPVLVPASLVIGLAVTGFLSSGAVGLAAVIVLFWVYHYIRQALAAYHSVSFLGF